MEPPDGDPLEAYRILFDISFFFFIVVILLAIIQGKFIHLNIDHIDVCFLQFSNDDNLHWLGFIIDAFGALRDQLDSVQDELENNCFICGIGKDYLDAIPHGFDIHVEKEHNLANYL